PTGTGASPLAHISEFVETTCPICGKPARRETDVSDNFLDSAWYYLRYPSSDDDTQPWDPKLTRKWLPVDMYIGGAEHSVLHLMYARFITMAMHDLGHLEFEEPFKRFRANGIITAEGAKISKSKGNVINPDEYIARYGADVFRTYLVFMGPYELGGDFSDRGIGGVVRFLERVWRLVERHATDARNGQPDDEARRILYVTIKRVTDDIAVLKYNTCIAALMEYLNSLEARPDAGTREELRALLLLLAPFAPYIAEELWERVSGSDESIHRQSWPTYDEAGLRRETVTIVVQVNGKVRGQLEMPREADESGVTAAALASERVRSAVGNATIRRTVYVPGRLINFVVG
ncbi:MAG TPA: class I tRNA ligase family protein, partial [Ktedonobacterales bacterium]|nr:class I tRNA ligase family protein [Ktedonobacterales bacterium]